MADPVITEADWNAALAEREAPEATPPEATPPATEAPEATEPQAVETPATEEPQVDPYTNLHPDVRAKLERFDQLASQHAQMVEELRRATGRIGALQSQWDKTRAQLEQPTQRQVAAAAKDPEKWEALKKDFPEWGEAIGEFVETRLGSITGGQGPTADQIEQLVAQRTEAATSELKKHFNESLVSLKHPKWRQEIKTAEFDAWFRIQGADTQALAASEDGFDAIRLMDLYDEHKTKSVKSVKEERQSRQAAAATTAKPSATGVVTKSLEDMTPQELWEYEARKRAAAT